MKVREYIKEEWAHYMDTCEWTELKDADHVFVVNDKLWAIYKYDEQYEVLDLKRPTHARYGKWVFYDEDLTPDELQVVKFLDIWRKSFSTSMSAYEYMLGASE